jgi:hypothetical protein
MKRMRICIWAIVFIGIIGVFFSLVRIEDLTALHFQIDQAGLISVVSISLALFGLYLALKQIELTKEVEVLEGMPEIVNEIARRIKKAEKRGEVYFLASTPAIGASGAPDGAKEIEKILIDFHKEEGLKPKKMCFLCYSSDDIERFYGEHGIPYKDTDVEQITQNIISKIDQLEQKQIAKMFKVEYGKIPMLHFLLVDPESTNKDKRHAVLWYLGHGEKEIEGTGISTNNGAVIKTLWKVFQRHLEIVEKKTDVCLGITLKKESNGDG